MKKLKLYGIIATVLIVIICGPAASWLQTKKAWADPDKQWDAVYLVCGARAQNNRLKALDTWWQQHQAASAHNLENIPSRANIPKNTLILIGSDDQQGLWCRKHQTNHSVTEWASNKISGKCSNKRSPKLSINIQPTIVPGVFSNTDGEMQALVRFLKANSEIQSLALVTSRYHARRAFIRLMTHLDSNEQITIGIVPGIKNINNRNPFVVILEYLKIFRDKLGLSHTPIISRRSK